MGDILDRRTLNRATLQRQSLLARVQRDVVRTVGSIGGLNAQHANDPYFALASRLDGFTLPDLTRPITDRTLVRSIMMRGTQHLLTADDFGKLRPVFAPLFARLQRNVFGRRTAGVDLDALVAEAEAILAEGPRTRPELGRMLAAGRPGSDATALGWSVQYLLPVVHPAPSGTWDVKGATPFELAPRRAERDEPADARFLVRRYLAAFGPALVSDIRAWSGVSGLPDVVNGMRDELMVFTDEKGRELFDLPDSPRPDPVSPAPVRLLAGFDNVLLAYHDRSRLMTDEVRAQVCVGDLIEQTVLVDGFVAGVWRLDRSAGRITVQPFERLAAADAEAAEVDGLRLLKLAAPDAPAHEVYIE